MLVFYELYRVFNSALSDNVYFAFVYCAAGINIFYIKANFHYEKILYRPGIEPVPVIFSMVLLDSSTFNTSAFGLYILNI